jgi:hypothetical protein
VRLEFVAGRRTRADYISLDLLPDSGVEEQPDTWGKIKALYR